MSTGIIIVIAFFLFAFLILCHEFGHFIVAKILGVNVLEFALGMGPAIVQFRRSEESTIYSLRLIPIGGFCQMYGEDAEVDDDDDEDDVDLNLDEDDEGDGVVTKLLFQTKTLFGKPLLKSPENLDPAGAFSAQPFLNRIAILLAGPFMNIICCLFLLFIVYKMQNYGVWMSIRAAFSVTGYIIVILAESLKQLFTGMVPLDQVSGIVGIAGVVTQQAKEGLINVVYLMAVLSANLGFVNLMPFPALDGGRIFLTLLTKLTGGRITPKMENMINSIGMILLLILMGILVFKDIFSFFK